PLASTSTTRVKFVSMPALKWSVTVVAVSARTPPSRDALVRIAWASASELAPATRSTTNRTANHERCMPRPSYAAAGSRSRRGQRPDGALGTRAAVATKPWDSRLARLMVLPLRRTRVHPNHITTAGMVTGLAAAACYASGVPAGANVGGGLFWLSALLDHADGELARMTGKTSDFGHAYDRAADLAVKLTMFTGMGLGLRHGPLGGWAVAAGFSAGVALIVIFTLRSAMARREGPSALVQPAFGGFEIEDILYVIAPITWLGVLQQFVLAAGLGAPLFAVWVARRYVLTRHLRRAPPAHPPQARPAGSA